MNASENRRGHNEMAGASDRLNARENEGSHPAMRRGQH